MLNVPGTMLIVRRKQKGKGMPSFVTCYFDKDIEDVISGKIHAYHIKKANILFGEAAILLSMEQYSAEIKVHRLLESMLPKSKSKKVQVMTLLYKNSIIKTLASPTQLKAWFTYPDIWEKKYYPQLLAKFEKDGVMNTLKKYSSY